MHTRKISFNFKYIETGSKFASGSQEISWNCFLWKTQYNAQQRSKRHIEYLSNN